MSPEAIVVQFLGDLIAAIPKLWELWSKLGARDAFLAALDSTLAAARAKTDGDLARKHASRATPDSGDDIASAVTAATLLPPALPVGAERIELRKSLTRALATGLGHDDLLRLRALRDELERSE